MSKIDVGARSACLRAESQRRSCEGRLWSLNLGLYGLGCGTMRIYGRGAFQPCG